MDYKDIVRLDLKEIYLGNIFTVDAPLNLPLKGEHGSDISWESSASYLIDIDGKVSRPYPGTGDREVILTATASYEGETAKREFKVTVLQKENPIKIKEAVDFKLEFLKNSNVKMPSVCIVKTEDDFFTTASVIWDDLPDFENLEVGEYKVTGKPIEKENNIIPVATIVIKENKKLESKEIKAKSFPLEDVKITSGNFYRNKKLMEDWLLKQDDDQMLYNFRNAAGLSTKNAKPMTGWDSPESKLRGHTTGHYLSALALMYASCENSKKESFKNKIDYMVNGLKECQEAFSKSGKYSDGFLSGYSEEQFDLLEEYVTYPTIWAPYYTLHKIMAGLLDSYEFCQNETALSICEKLGLWVYERLSKLTEEKRQKMWAMYIAGEYGGMNEVLARLNRFKENKRFILGAEFFTNDKLFLPMKLGIDTLGGIHANQHIPQIIGAMELFKNGRDVSYYDLSRNFWHMVIEHHTYPLGGTGEGEMFHRPDEISALLTDKNAETCATYNMLKLTKELFSYEPQAYYMDYYENALFNHITSSFDFSDSTGGTTYFMPLKCGCHKEFETDSNSCCHGTGLESPAKYQESIYFCKEDTLFVNLYIPSELNWKDRNFKITQIGDFIKEEKIKFEIINGGETKIKFRIPHWIIKPLEIEINNIKINYETEDGYAVIDRLWEDGDSIEVYFSMGLRKEIAVDNKELFTLHYGPLLIGAESESEDFIEISNEDLEKISSPSFSFNGIKFRPLSEFLSQPYSIYFKNIVSIFNLKGEY